MSIRELGGLGFRARVSNLGKHRVRDGHRGEGGEEQGTSPCSWSGAEGGPTVRGPPGSVSANHRGCKSRFQGRGHSCRNSRVMSPAITCACVTKRRTHEKRKTRVTPVSKRREEWREFRFDACKYVHYFKSLNALNDIYAPPAPERC